MTADPEENGASREAVDEPPPFMGTWGRVYAFVLCYLAVVIFAFWVFEHSWSG